MLKKLELTAAELLVEGFHGKQFGEKFQNSSLNMKEFLTWAWRRTLFLCTKL